MLNLVLLDKLSLTLCLTKTHVRHFADKHVSISEMLYEMVEGKELEALRRLDDLDTKSRIDHLLAASLIWHEKRHFIDILLTNFGAYQTRRNFELFFNAPIVIQEAKVSKKLACPIDIYADTVRRCLLNIDVKDDSNLPFLAAHIQRNMDMLKADRRQRDTPQGPFIFGSTALFEALAVMSQLSRIESLYGFSAVLDIQHRLQEVGLGQSPLTYFWFHAISQTIGQIEDKSTHERWDIKYSAFLYPIIFASLCTLTTSSSEGREASHQLPSDRFLLLWARLLPALKHLIDMDPAAIFHAVDNAAEELWHIGIIDGILNDHKKDTQFMEMISGHRTQNPHCVDAFADYHALRTRLINQFISDPGLFIDCERTSKELIPKTHPLIVYRSPDGEYDAPRGSRPILQDSIGDPEHNGNRLRWVWSTFLDLPAGISDENVGFSKIENWYQIVKFWAPFVHIITSGRRSRDSFGPDLLFIETFFNIADVELLFDPVYKYPEEINQEYYRKWYLDSEQTYKCDLTGEALRPEECFFVSPWTIRLSKHNFDYFAKRYPEFALSASWPVPANTNAGFYFGLRKDWSIWRVSQKVAACLEEVGFKRPTRSKVGL